MSLLKYGKENFSTKKIIKKDQLIGKKYIYGIEELGVNLIADDDLYITSKQNENIKSELTLKEIKYPIKRGESLGVIKYYDSNGNQLGKLNIVSQNDLAEISLKYKIKIFLRKYKS